MIEAALEDRISSQLLRFDGAEPVFVVGSVRSGTSIVMESLRSGGELRGFSEGNVGSMIQRLLDVLDSHAEDAGSLAGDRRSPTMIAEAEALRNRVCNYLCALYMKLMGPGPWLDKSPESYPSAPMLRLTPTLRKLFPKARFVVCLRRGIEQIRSSRRKFPNIPFQALCQSWADCAESWSDLREELGPSATEVRQNQIALEPHEVARRLAAFLGMDAERARAMGEIFANKRPEQSQFAQEHRFLGLDEAGWSDEEQEIFQSRCSRAMALHGFPMEGVVLVASAAIRLFYPVSLDAVAFHNLPSNAGFRRAGPKSIEVEASAPSQAPAEVRYLRVPLKGQCSFHAKVALAQKAAAAVDLSLRIEDAEGRSVASFAKTIKPGSEEEWHEEFAPLNGVHDVLIGARMREGSEARGTWARWIDARLES